jgi:hypothetical protein
VLKAGPGLRICEREDIRRDREERGDVITNESRIHTKWAAPKWKVHTVYKQTVILSSSHKIVKKGYVLNKRLLFLGLLNNVISVFGGFGSLQVCCLEAGW